MRSRAALLSSAFFLSLAAAGAVGACAAVLGFDDTTLRSGDGSTLDDGQPPQDGGTDQDGHTLADGAPSRLTTNPSSITVRRSGSAVVAVDIERGADVTGDITIELTNLPTGVTATKAMLSGATSTGSITVTASSMAALGPASASLVADGASLPASPIPVLVEGPSGTLDTTFGPLGAGLVSDATKGSASTFYALALQSDGKIVAAGSGGATPGWFVRRFGPLGAAEPAFVTMQAASLPADGTLHAVAIDSKGNIVCVGTAGTPAQLTVARLLKSGAIDNGFGTGGIAKSTDTVLGSEGLGVAIAADDSIVVSGARTTLTPTSNGILERFKPNGNRDTTFGLVDIPSARLVGVTIDATGAILAGGTQTSSPKSFLSTKRLATGAADPGFGSAGIATFDSTDDEANGFARLSTGELLFAGDRMDSYAVGVGRPDGTKIYERLLSTTTQTSMYGVVGFDKKSYVVAGHSSAVNGEARVQRMLTNGQPDTTFGMQAIAIIEDAGPGNATDVTLFAAAVQPDTRILVAGNRSTAGATLYRLWP